MFISTKLIFSDKVDQWLPRDEVGEARERQEERINRNKRKLGGGRYVHYPDCGDGSLVVCMGQNLSNCAL